MPSKHDPGRSNSDYDAATLHLLIAFFCVTGQTAQDERLRKAIETVLVNVTKAEIAAAPPNIVKFCRRGMRTDN